MATNQTPLLAGPTRPLGSPEIPQFYAPTSTGEGVYAPRLYGAARIHFADKKRKLDETRRVAFLIPLEAGVRAIDWESSQPTTTMPEGLLEKPADAAKYLPLPAGAMDVKVFTRWAKQFDRWLARTQRLELGVIDESGQPVTLGPKRGGVSVELVAIVWERV